MLVLRPLIGRPWAMPADPPQTFDCWSLTEHVRSLLGLRTPSYVDVSKRSPADRHTFDERTEADWHRLLTPTLGCVARLGPDHIGVYVGSDQVIHAQHGYGVRVDRISMIKLADPVTLWELNDA